MNKRKGIAEECPPRDSRCVVTLRLPESLKQAAKRITAADDTTMNQFFVVAIAQKISAMETAKFFEQRAASVQAGDAQAAWDKVAAKAALKDDHWKE